MKKIAIAIGVVLTLTFTACNRGPQAPDHDTLAHTIDSIEAPIMEAAQIASIDTAKGRQLVELYVQFADAFPKDSLAATYLARAASVSNGMGNIDDMVTYFDRVINDYPDYEHLDECYYVKGIALDNAGRRDEARATYEAFLDLFPDHFLAHDIQQAIMILDKSDQWLIDTLTAAK